MLATPGRRISSLLILAMTVFASPFPAKSGDGSFSSRASEGWRWRTSLSTGLDAYSHTYALATEDTTESLVEYLLTAAVAGRSDRRARHGGFFRAEGSLGSELFRQRLEGEYRFRDAERRIRFRLGGRLRGRQYHSGTDYMNTSDNIEGRFYLRGQPLARSKRALEVRGSLDFLEYAAPSSLEVSHHTGTAGLSLGSQDWRGPTWKLGVALDARSYPDSTQIDRRRILLDGQYEIQGEDRGQLLVMHRSERRHIRDAMAKPSGWLHWTDAVGQVGAGAGQVFLELQSERWDYDREESAYQDSWRLKSLGGYTWGDVLTATWRLGLAWERLWSADDPEAFNALGLVGGVEAMSGPVSGSLSLEWGRRHYTEEPVDWDVPENVGSSGDDLGGSGSARFYSDFSYLEIWLMGSWSLDPRFTLEVQASYEPENHTEQEDDSALGFATVRLVYRP